MVAYLIESGADGRMHPVTKYSPLYIAAYNGKKEVGRQRAQSRLEYSAFKSFEDTAALE